MDKVAVVSGADRGLGFALAKELLLSGWCVFAGQYLDQWKELDKLEMSFKNRLFIKYLNVGSDGSVCSFAQEVAKHVGYIDMIVSNAAIYSGRNELGTEIDYTAMQRTYNVNSIGALRMVKALLPLTDMSKLKRLCFVSSEAGSISLTNRAAEFGYCMSKAALNMAVRIMYNHLRPEGYTFRLYHPGWMKSYMGGGGKSTCGDLEPEESAAIAVPFFTEDREDEDRFVMIDNNGREMSL